MSVAAIIPFRAKANREASLDRVVEHLAPMVDQVVVCDDGGDPFSRGASINAGAEEAAADTFVICDADLLVPERQLLQALNLGFEDGMVMPFNEYRYLDKADTRRVQDGADPSMSMLPKFVMSNSVGGCCVIDSFAFWAVGGFDPRFRGWGGEDRAFHSAIDTMVGNVIRIDGPAYHLWHPVEKTRPRLNRELEGRYEECRGDIPAMRRLIADRKVAA
jgi:predicted glycosyltransferase involved in capsule biosynthesis